MRYVASADGCFRRQDQGRVYYRCCYTGHYGKVAAKQLQQHGVTCNMLEDKLLPEIERFVATRVFGPMRLDLLRNQQKEIAPADRAIAAQVRALEVGVEPTAVQARIDELKDRKTTAEASLPNSR